MVIDFSAINWLVVIVATAVYFVLGGLWFSPVAFEKVWDKGLGFKRPKGWKPGPQYFIVPLIGCFIISATTALLLHATGVHSLNGAIALGLLVGIGYAATSTGVLSVSPTTPRPDLLSAVVGSYHVLGILIASVIIYAIK